MRGLASDFWLPEEAFPNIAFVLIASTFSRSFEGVNPLYLKGFEGTRGSDRVACPEPFTGFRVVTP